MVEKWVNIENHSSYFNGKRKTHHGYKWIWECDYLDTTGGALS